MDSQNYGPNWSICRDIERSVASEPSVFVATSVVASCIMSRPVLLACSWIVSRHTLMISQHKLYSAVLFLSRQECLRSRHTIGLHPASHVLVLLEFVATQFFLSLQTIAFQPVNSIVTEFSLSRQDFFKFLAISVVTRNPLVATNFSSLILVTC